MNCWAVQLECDTVLDSGSEVGGVFGAGEADVGGDFDEVVFGDFLDEAEFEDVLIAETLVLIGLVKVVEHAERARGQEVVDARADAPEKLRRLPPDHGT